VSSAARTITEPAREILVVAEADVVVCGGGPGGFPAAIAAARHGARTVLIERYGFLGGLATAGLVSPILAHTASESDTPIVEGLLREVTERMHALGCASTWEETCQRRGIAFDAEALKLVLDEMCQEAGVAVLFHTHISDVLVRHDASGFSIDALVVENKSGRQAVTGKVFIDATGDADIAQRAGARTTHGRTFDGRPESMGSFFQLSGIEPLTADRQKELHELIRREMEDGRFRFYNPGFLGRNTHHKDHTSANMTRFPGDSDVAADITRAEVGVRKEVWDLVRYLRATVPESLATTFTWAANSRIISRGDRGGSISTVRWGIPIPCICAWWNAPREPNAPTGLPSTRGCARATRSTPPRVIGMAFPIAVCFRWMWSIFSRRVGAFPLPTKAWPGRG
jgi:ribulose 1,5-bisphosphate synthetase/thiazole synthase